MQGIRFFLGLTLVVALATLVSQSTIITASAASDSASHAPAPASIVNRSRSIAPGQEGRSHKIKDAKESMSSPELALSFDSLNFCEQRLANDGNQFSIEPPDQALCVGNGFVLESVHDVLPVFDTAGNPLTDVIHLNTFYGYPAQINRAPWRLKRLAIPRGPTTASPSGR
jgi:hypothetical protein